VHCHNNVYSFASTEPAIPIVLASGNSIPPFPLRKFKVMLCDCWVSIKVSETYDKLAPRRAKGVHLGYDTRRKGYFVWLPELGRITTASDVEFSEDSFTQLAAARPGVKILQRAHNKELPEVLPVTAALAGLSTDVEHSRKTAGRARFAKAVAADAAASAAPTSPAALPRRLPPAPSHAPPPRRCRAPPCRRRPPPRRLPRRLPPSPCPSRSLLPPRASTVPAGARAALPSPPRSSPRRTTSSPTCSTGTTTTTSRPARSPPARSADTVLLVGSVMGEAYRVDLNIGIVPIPRSYAAAVADPVYGAKWRVACDDDYKGKYTLLKT